MAYEGGKPNQSERGGWAASRRVSSPGDRDEVFTNNRSNPERPLGYGATIMPAWRLEGCCVGDGTKHSPERLMLPRDGRRLWRRGKTAARWAAFLLPTIGTVFAELRSGPAGLAGVAAASWLVVAIAAAALVLVCLACITYCVLRATPGVAHEGATALRSWIRRWGEGVGSSEPGGRHAQRRVRS